jgi:hypothetical protein
MASYSGSFHYLDEKGAEVRQGQCKVTIDPPNLFLTPQSGQSLSIDLGDIDQFVPEDYRLSLVLYTGRSIVLDKFAKTFSGLLDELSGAYRDRLVECLLLEDLEEIGRFEAQIEAHLGGTAFSGPAQLRLYKSNVAILPTRAVGFQWRLADVDAIDFDDTAYRVIVRSGDDRIEVSKLAKRTEEFVERLRGAFADVSENSAAIVRSLCPFLTPDQMVELGRLLPEGRCAPFSRIDAVDRRIQSSLVSNSVNTGLKPYFDSLRSRADGQEWFTGFKMIRPEAEEAGDEELSDADGARANEGAANGAESNEAPVDQPPEPENEEGEGKIPVLHWYFFPLKGEGARSPNVVAWEATSRSGRATYFFRIAGDPSAPAQAGPGEIEAKVRQLNRALVLLDFRREPIYLPDKSLEMESRYRRYAIACRKIHVLRDLRASFIGRAIHTSPQGWQKQVEAILRKA